MATGTNIKTYFDGTWHDGDLSIIKAADHGAWLGTTVFDGARLFDGLSPDLEAHCARINRSARALMINRTTLFNKMRKYNLLGTRPQRSGGQRVEHSERQ